MKRGIDNKIYRKDVFVKFVKKAGMWCKTHWNNRGEQNQNWSLIKPDAIRPDEKE